MIKNITAIPCFYLMALLAVLMAACSPVPFNKVEIKTDNLIAGKSIGLLNCRYRLLAVNDTRPDGSRAGGLGLNKLSFAEPADYVKAQLYKAGMLPANASDGRNVVVDIKHVYLNQNNITKIPTVVYEVQINESDKFIIRGQIASMNWSASQNEAYDAFADAFQSANAQLLAKLNKSCAN